ncbi:MAG: hypothetical protein C0617_07840 [Desulfuromonas sp.]|uniref:putative signal transducing protein n=1 Tax=Desulfuromonas sp. TaxID=892 RepID=UPI000CB78A41|nr:DUF2007 domain-containing protein [Desulfuromonas sp.]PLX84393.1 MAG: hypothetical protein C0617_07840 [Desulfuromonas sp.]
MKKLRTFGLAERAQAGLLKEFLEKEGVACVLRNERLFAALGEIPFTECFPELWVVDDEVYPRAKALLENWLEDGPPGEPWTCAGCGERLEGQFGACWKCGRRRTAVTGDE